MRSVGIKTLKNKLSQYVKYATAGERVLVVDRDVVVAELVPPAPGSPPQVSDAVLLELMRRGLVSPPADPQAPLEEAVSLGKKISLLSDLLQDREG